MLVSVHTNRVYQMDAQAFLMCVPDRSVDLVFIDPPYGNSNGKDLAGDRARNRVKGGRSKGVIQTIANDDATAWAKLMPGVMMEIGRVLKPEAACVVMCAGGGPSTPVVQVIAWMQKWMVFDHLAVWDKTGQGYGMGHKYRRCHELLVIGHKRNGRLKWAQKRPARPDIIKVKPIQQGKSPKENRKLHENQKPEDLAREFILNHTNPGNAVLDCFVGSGTTLVAAQSLGRTWYGCDIEPEHVETTRSRLEWGITQDMFASILPESGNTAGG